LCNARNDRELVVVEDGAVLQVDELARRRFVQAIFPHIRDFYVDWTLPKPEPFYAVHGTR
jgi:hypothetical protein